MRDVAWGFFYGTVNFDTVFGTINYYGEVEMFAGEDQRGLHLRRPRLHRALPVRRADGRVQGDDLRLDQRGLRPVRRAAWKPACPGARRTVTTKTADHPPARHRQAHGRPARRHAAAHRRDGFPVNRMFQDVEQDQPEVHAEPGFETSFRPSTCSATSRAPTSPGTHRSARWSTKACSARLQKSSSCRSSTATTGRVVRAALRRDHLDVKDGKTGRDRAVVTMKAGDVSCMPADIRHQGYSNKRSMLLVWENGSPKIPDLIRSGKAPVASVGRPQNQQPGASRPGPGPRAWPPDFHVFNGPPG